jgi:nucleoside phosphorylase
LIAGRDKLYFWGQEPHIVAFDYRSTNITWTCTSSADRGTAILQPPIISDISETLFVVLRNDTVMAVGQGAVIWRVPPEQLGDQLAQPVLDHPYLYIGNRRGNVYALEAATGQKIWEKTVIGKVTGLQVTSAGLLYVTSSAGQLYVFDKSTGEIRWCYGQLNSLRFPPLVLANHVYVADSKHNLIAFPHPPQINNWRDRAWSLLLQGDEDKAAYLHLMHGSYVQAWQPAIGQKVFDSATDNIRTSDQRARLVRLRTESAQKSLSPLFKPGVCQHYPLPKSHNEFYFLSHDFDEVKVGYLRQALLDGLGMELKPYLSNLDSQPGMRRLCRIAANILTAYFALINLPDNDAPNVYLELGLTVGLGRPYYLVHSTQASPPAFLQGLDTLIYEDFSDLRQELAVQKGTLRLAVGQLYQFTDELARTQHANSFLIAANGWQTEKVTMAISRAFQPLHYEPLVLGEQIGSSYLLNTLIEMVRAAKFAVFHADERCSPEVFFCLGIAIATNVPWLLVAQQGTAIPINLTGLDIFRFKSLEDLERNFLSYCKIFLRRHGIAMKVPQEVIESSAEIERVSTMNLDKPVDVVIITGLPKEREAILKYLNTPEKMTRQDEYSFYQATIPTKSGGSYQVVIVTLPKMGNLQAALATNQAIAAWKPTHVLLVGIAGGINKSERYLGDVVVGEQIVYYELGRQEPGGAQRSYEVYRPAKALLEAARNLAPQEWALSIKYPRPDGTTGRVVPKVYFGVVASGDKVIAEARFTEELKSDWSKLVAVEMEGAGSALAAYESEGTPGILLVKGICDWADEGKNDEWQEYAAESAACFAITLLQSGSFASKTGPELVPKDRPSFSGKIKIEFCKRILDDWEDFADFLGIPLDQRRRFRSGKEGRDIWDWLEQRDRLEDLSGACAYLGRKDLHNLLVH